MSDFAFGRLSYNNLSLTDQVSASRAEFISHDKLNVILIITLGICLNLVRLEEVGLINEYVNADQTLQSASVTLSSLSYEHL